MKEFLRTRSTKQWLAAFAFAQLALVASFLTGLAYQSVAIFLGQLAAYLGIFALFAWLGHKYG